MRPKKARLGCHRGARMCHDVLRYKSRVMTRTFVMMFPCVAIGTYSNYFTCWCFLWAVVCRTEFLDTVLQRFLLSILRHWQHLGTFGNIWEHLRFDVVGTPWSDEGHGAQIGSQILETPVLSALCCGNGMHHSDHSTSARLIGSDLWQDLKLRKLQHTPALQSCKHRKDDFVLAGFGSMSCRRLTK